MQHLKPTQHCPFPAMQGTMFHEQTNLVTSVLRPPSRHKVSLLNRYVAAAKLQYSVLGCSGRAAFAGHVCNAQVFSQWKDALLVVSKALSAHSIGHVSLTGGRQGKVWSSDPLEAHWTVAFGKAVLPVIG